jgi:hypothetical protein
MADRLARSVQAEHSVAERILRSDIHCVVATTWQQAQAGGHRNVEPEGSGVRLELNRPASPPNERKGKALPVVKDVIESRPR